MIDRSVIMWRSFRFLKRTTKFHRQARRRYSEPAKGEPTTAVPKPELTPRMVRSAILRRSWLNKALTLGLFGAGAFMLFDNLRGTKSITGVSFNLFVQFPSQMKKRYR